MSTDQPEQTRTHVVQGMSCAHCVASVTEEVAEVPGVREVNADLASGQLVVTGHDLDDEAIAAAVEEAGYKLAS